jgi:hypothetical protein
MASRAAESDMDDKSLIWMTRVSASYKKGFRWMTKSRSKLVETFTGPWFECWKLEDYLEPKLAHGFQTGLIWMKKSLSKLLVKKMPAVLGLSVSVKEQTLNVSSHGFKNGWVGMNKSICKLVQMWHVVLGWSFLEKLQRHEGRGV